MVDTFRVPDLIKRRVALEVALGAAHDAKVQVADVTFQPPSRGLPNPTKWASCRRIVVVILTVDVIFLRVLPKLPLVSVKRRA